MLSIFIVYLVAPLCPLVRNNIPEDKNIHVSVHHSTSRAGEVAREVEVLVTKPDDPSLIPRTHMVEARNRLLQVVL